MPQTPATRWCPTTEQLMILEEMYRSGMRTPNSMQIEEITDHLSFFGKIEGKNVFYWFQNHKARERQRLRNAARIVRTNFPQGQQLQQPDPTLPHPHYYNPSHDILEGALQVANQGMDLLGKLEADGSHKEEHPTSLKHGCEWLSMMTAASSAGDLQTLELFPIKSTSLKDECGSSKSSCSISTG